MQKSLHKWRLNLFVLSFLCCLCSFHANSQLNYSFSTINGSYNSISGTSVFGSNTDNGLSNTLPIGFSFRYGCNLYTEFRVSSNGWLSLGNYTLQSIPANALGTTNNGPIIAPLWDDLLTQGGNLVYTTNGSSGNKILTVQWSFIRWDKSASSSTLSFQVKLYEATGVIEFIYDDRNGSVNNGSASIGISGGFSSTDFYSVSGNNGSAVATYGVETNNINQKPSDGRTYRWTPQNMSYVSTTTTQVTGPVSMCNNLQQAIIGVQVVTSGCLNALNTTKFQITKSGTVTADITGIHIYYTGDAPGFSPVNEFGGGTITPATGTITVNGTQALVAGTNYFWIAYDVSSSATLGNGLDAQCTQVTVGGTNRTPTVTSPTGSRQIANCTAAPGGITNPSFWVKADAGTSSTVNNTSISSWNDQSGNNRHATNGTVANQPKYINSAGTNMNFNPLVDFVAAHTNPENGSYMDINTNGILSTDNNPYEVYAVIVPDAYSLTKPGKFLFAGDVNSNNFNSFDVRSSYSFNDSWNSNDLIIANKWSTGNLSMVTFEYNYSRREMFLAGTSIGSLTSLPRSSPNINGALGYQRSSNLEFYDGSIAEIITYANTSHNTTAREKVESYLAIKYGVTLGHDYIASNNTTVWDISTNASYNNNIIGIARDDNGALLQKQSKSTSVSKDILTVYIGPTKQVDQATNTGTFAGGNASFFMVGSNNGAPLDSSPQNPEKPSGICCRIYREWLVQQTNFSNTDLKLEFNFNSVTTGYLPLNAADLRLLVDADGNFTNATILGTPTISITAGSGVATITVPASAFSGKPYFTLASVSTNTLLPLELRSFTGSCRDNAVQLTWVAEQAIHSDIIVERSTDRTNFTAAGNIKANASGYYNWTDASPLPGTQYYRLTTKADNGSMLYSSIVTVNACNKNHTMLSTNPATGESVLTLQMLQDETVEISLYDGLGQRLTAPGLTGKQGLSRGVHYLPVNLPGHAAGLYLLSVRINGQQQVFRVLKR